MHIPNKGLLRTTGSTTILLRKLGPLSHQRCLAPALPCSYEHKGILTILIFVHPRSAAGLLTGEVVLGRNEGGPLLTHHNLLSSSPGFGPVFTTSDPDSFWQQLNEIHALGGGDEPEMCLSALEVHPPPPLPLLLPSFPGPTTKGS